MASPRDIRAGAAFVELGIIDDKLREGLERASKRLTKFAATVAKVGAAVTSIGLVPLTGLFTLAKLAAGTGDTLNNLAARTGLAVGEIAALDRQAINAGSSIEDVEAAVRKLQVQIAELGRGSGAAVEQFRKFGLAASDLVGKSPYEQLLQIADALERITDPAQRAYLATELLGKSGTKLIPILDGGSKGLREAYREYERLGIITGAVAAAQVGVFDNVFNDVMSQVGALKDVVGAAAAETFLPYLEAVQPLLASIIRLANENRSLVAKIIVGASAFVLAGTAITGAGVALYFAGKAMLGFSAALKVAFLPLRLFTGTASLAMTVVRGLGTVFSAGMSILSGTAGVAASAVAKLGGVLYAMASGTISYGIGLIADSIGAIGSMARLALPQVFRLFGSLINVVTSAITGLVSTVIPVVMSVIGTIASAAASAIAGAAIFLGSVLSAALIPVVIAAGAVAAGYLAYSIAKGVGGITSGIGTMVDALVGKVTTVLGKVASAVTAAFQSAYSAVVNILSGIGNFFVGIGRNIIAGFSNIASYIGNAATSVAGFFRDIPGYASKAFKSMAVYGAQASAYIGGIFKGLQATLGQTFQGAIDALRAGDLALAGEIAFTGLQLAWQKVVLSMKVIWFAAKQEIVNFAIDKYITIATAFSNMTGTMQVVWVKALTGLRAAWVTFASAISGIWETVMDRFEDGWLVIISKISGQNIADLRMQALEQRWVRNRDLIEDANRQLADIATGSQQRIEDIRAQVTERNAELAKLKELIQTVPSEAAKKSIDDTVAEIARLQKQLDAKTVDAKDKREKAEKKKRDEEDKDDKFQQAIKAIGVFNSGALAATFAGGSASQIKLITRATERTAKATEKSLDVLDRLANRRGIVFV